MLKKSYAPFQDYDSYYDRRGFDDTRDLYERRFTGMTGMSGNKKRHTAIDHCINFSPCIA